MYVVLSWLIWVTSLALAIANFACTSWFTSLAMRMSRMWFQKAEPQEERSPARTTFTALLGRSLSFHEPMMAMWPNQAITVPINAEPR